MEFEILGFNCAIAYILTLFLIPKVGQVFIRKGRFGKDLLKAEQPITYIYYSNALVQNLLELLSV